MLPITCGNFNNPWNKFKNFACATIVLSVLHGCAASYGIEDFHGKHFINVLTVESTVVQINLDDPVGDFGEFPIRPTPVEARVQYIEKSKGTTNFLKEMRYILYTPGCNTSSRLACAYFLRSDEKYVFELIDSSLRSNNSHESAWVLLSWLRDAGLDGNDRQQALTLLKRYCEETLIDVSLDAKEQGTSMSYSTKQGVSVGSEVLRYIEQADSSFYSAFRQEVKEWNADWPF